MLKLYVCALSIVSAVKTGGTSVHTHTPEVRIGTIGRVVAGVVAGRGADTLRGFRRVAAKNEGVAKGGIVAWGASRRACLASTAFSVAPLVCVAPTRAVRSTLPTNAPRRGLHSGEYDGCRLARFKGHTRGDVAGVDGELMEAAL